MLIVHKRVTDGNCIDIEVCHFSFLGDTSIRISRKQSGLWQNTEDREKLMETVEKDLLDGAAAEI